MPKKDITTGEMLCTFIKRNVLAEPVWSDLEVHLAGCGRGYQWAAFMEEVIATQMTGRLVTAGVSIAESLGKGAKGVDAMDFRAKLEKVAGETMDTSLARQKRQQLFDLITRAVLATYGNVTSASRKLIEEEAGRVPRCFLCNQKLIMLRSDGLIGLSSDKLKLAVEDEHIWPRSYGGDSKTDNLALACHNCNQNKTNFANWAMVGIQSLVLGLPATIDADTPDALRKIPGWQRFALTSYAAHAIADSESLTLKQAHYRLKARALPHPRVKRTADVVDFFNLVHHVEDD